MEAFTVTVTVYVEGENYEPEAMEETVTEWVAGRLWTPTVVGIAADTYVVARVEVKA